MCIYIYDNITIYIYINIYYICCFHLHSTRRSFMCQLQFEEAPRSPRACRWGGRHASSGTSGSSNGSGSNGCSCTSNSDDDPDGDDDDDGDEYNDGDDY